MPTYVRSSGAWVPVSGSSSAGTDVNTVGAANQVLYKNSINVAVGTNNLTFDGTNLSAAGYGQFVTPNAGSTGGVRIRANGVTGNAYLQFTNNAVSSEYFSLLGTPGVATFSGIVVANSDRKLKTNIKTISNALDKVTRLRGVEYDRIDYDKHEIGVVAQEVEEVIPELVHENNEIKSVAYGNMVALLIEAIKEQNQKIEDLTVEINKLKKGGK